MGDLYTFHLFAGAGGGILADALLGHWPLGAIEIEPYPRGVLLQRQRDGLLPPFPVWDDVRTFRADNPDCAEYIEGLRAARDGLAVCGGFPCQDISSAGKKAGIAGARSRLWGEMARIVREIRPRYVFVENVAAITSRGLGVVLGDLAAMGFDARWGVLGSCCAGATHRRERMWITAVARAVQGASDERDSRPDNDSAPQGGRWRPDLSRGAGPEPGCDTSLLGLEDGRADGVGGGTRAALLGSGPWGSREPGLDRMADGVADRVDRHAAIGNGQVPALAALAWEVLADG